MHNGFIVCFLVILWKGILFSEFEGGLFVVVLVVALVFWVSVEIDFRVFSCSSMSLIRKIGRRVVTRRVSFAAEFLSVAVIVAIGGQDAGVGVGTR